MGRAGRNDPCPCGSGKKHKKCCEGKDATSSFTRDERLSALHKLARFVARELPEEDELARRAFWGKFAGREGEVPAEFLQAGDGVRELWFAADRPLPDGGRVLDRFLDRADLTAGERHYVRALGGTTMRLYDVLDVAPGSTLTLRDALEGGTVTVREQAGSRTIDVHARLAGRVLQRGASGQPELDMGLMVLPPLLHENVLEQAAAARDAFRREHPLAEVADFYREMAPFFHSAWVGSILDPYVPELRNTDGEPLVATLVTFEVADAGALAAALHGVEGLEQEDASTWHWSGGNQHGKSVSLGRLVIGDGSLVLQANSVERGARGRAKLEALTGTALRHRATTHEDVGRRVREELASGRGRSPEADAGASGLPREVQEALVLDQYAQYYRSWMSEPVPALDGKTPRDAAGDAQRRPALEGILRDLEAAYQGALRRGEPAFDPSWLRAELGLEERPDPAHPPPLAPERVAALVPGSGELCQAVAAKLRRAPGFDDSSTVVTEEALGADLDVQRFLRERENGPRLGPYLPLLIDFELHRRKSFWVDPPLAYLLARTDLDVVGRELRLPFPSFALIFTDRHVLSLAERLLSAERAPLAGLLLRVATVFVTEELCGDARRLRVTFALDALGADLPHLVRHELPLPDDGPVEAYLDAVAPRVTVEPAVADANPLRGLLQVTVNAILYATSAGVEPESRQAPAPGFRRSSEPPAGYSSEHVYFLPGAIEISQARRLRELEGLEEGRSLLRRFLVRGHWRRASPRFADQRLRWIRPHWKGPDLAAIIERTYRLKA